jgi:hypothetical protein
MPNYKGHLVGGFIAYVLLFFALGCYGCSYTRATEWLLFTLAGSLFPDIDIKSKGQKYFYYIVFIFFIFLSCKGHYQTLSLCSFIVITPMLVRHRGIFHRLWFIVFIAFLAWCLISIIVPSMSYSLFLNTLFFIVGAISHLWLDLGFSKMISPRGYYKKKKG